MHIRQTLLTLYAVFLIKVCSAYVPIGTRKQLARAITDDVTFQAFCSGHVPFVRMENALSCDTMAGIYGKMLPVCNLPAMRQLPV